MFQAHSRSRALALVIIGAAALLQTHCASGPPSRIDPPPDVDMGDWGSPPAPPDVDFFELAGPLDGQTCGDALASLREAQRRTAAVAGPWVVWANAALAHTFNGILDEFWPDWITHYEAFAPHRSRSTFPDAEIWRAYQCGHAAYDYLAGLSDCYETMQPCGASPRIVVDDVLGVAFAEPVDAVPDHCETSDVGPYPVEAVRASAQQAARAVSERFDPAWLDWAARQAALHRLETQLDRWCRNAEDPQAAPWDEGTFGEVQTAVAALRAPLAELPTGVWLPSRGRVRVPPAGPMTRVLTFEPAPGSPAQRANEAAAALPLWRRAQE